MSSSYLDIRDRLEGVLMLKPDAHEEYYRDIINSFQRGRLTHEQRQELLDEIDRLLNNHYNYLVELQQPSNPELEVNTGNSNEIILEGGKKRQSRNDWHMSRRRNRNRNRNHNRNRKISKKTKMSRRK